jgi:hypothetical protein
LTCLTSFYFNVPPANSPIPHATYFPYYILEYTIIFWVAYAGCEFVYFSVDWIPSYTIRWNAHKVATIFMGFYILYIALFVWLVTLDVIYVKDPNLQAAIFGMIILFISILEVDFVLWAWKSQSGIIRRLIRAIRKRRNRLPEWKDEIARERVASQD